MPKPTLCAAALAVLAAAFAPVPAVAQSSTRTPLAVHISVDMEGIAGVVSGEQLSPSGFEYARFREFMTREALAAVMAAKEAGATDIIVTDAHGNGQNLLIEQFPPDVRLVRSGPRELSMMAGVNRGAQASIFIGYHASTTNAEGVRAHTFSSATLARVALNGVDVTEGAWNAAIAGHFGVPVVFVSGDDVAVEEVKRLVGDIETVPVKTALGFHSALTMTPAAAAEAIGTKVKAALARRSTIKPYVVQTPVTVDVTFKNYLPAEVLAYLPLFERTSSHAIRFRAKDMVEASRIMTFVTSYHADLTP